MRSRFGATTPTWESRKLMNSPFGSTASTTISPMFSRRSTIATVSLRDPLRSVQRISCDQNRLNSRHRSQSTPHFALASDVNATERPRPYRQVASTGSSWWLIRTMSAVAFSVLAT